MNKLLYLLLFLVIALLTHTTSVAAQRQVQDYTFHFEKYRTVYDEYTVAKNEFLKQNSLTSQREALTKTKEVLLQRATVLRIYLGALRYTMNTTPGIPNESKVSTSAKLDEEMGWLQNHIDDLSGMSNPTLTELFEISARLERKKSEYVSLAHIAMAHILIGRVKQANQDLAATNAVLEPMVSRYQNTFIKNWYDQSVDMTLRCDQSVSNALAMTEKLDDQYDETRASQSLAEIKTELAKGKQQIQNGVNYQNEILKELNKLYPKATPVLVTNQPTASSSGH